MPEICRRRRVRHLVKRKTVLFKIRKDSRWRNRAAVVQSNPSEAEIELRQQNGSLAFALNESKEENARILNHVNNLNADIIELRGQLAQLKAAREEERRSVEEVEFQRRLAEYMEPQKVALNKALDHIVGLSQSLEAAMKMASAPGRRSKQSFPSSANRSLPPQSPKLQNGPLNLRSPSVAQVAPMVKGHGIHKPNVRIQRLNLDDLNMLTRPQHRNNDDRNVENDISENTGNAETNDAAGQIVPNDMDVDVDVDDDDDEVELSVQRPRRRHREPEPSAMEPVIEEEEEEEEDEDNIGGSTVYLLPRLVLERVTISPNKNVQRRSSHTGRRSTISTQSRRSSLGPTEFVLANQRRSANNGHVEVEDTPEEDPANYDDEDDFDSHWTKSPESRPRRTLPNRKVSFQFEGASLSPIPFADRVRKRGRSSIMKRELKVVVSDIRKSSEFSLSGRPAPHLMNGASGTNGSSSDNEACDFSPESEGTTHRAAASPVEPTASVDESLFLEMYDYDPLEGPSWLLDTPQRRRFQKPRVSKPKSLKSEPEPVKPEAVKSKAANGTSTRVRTVAAESLDSVQVSQSNRRLNGSSAAPSSSTQEAAGDVEAGDKSRMSEPTDDESTRESGRPSKRRAAAAMASFKEPSLNKKLRQGDDLNKDLKFKEVKKKKRSGGGGGGDKK